MEKNIAQIIPPITTRANGLELSDPIPCEIAAGNKPIAAIKAVIITGLTFDLTPVRMAWYEEA